LYQILLYPGSENPKKIAAKKNPGTVSRPPKNPPMQEESEESEYTEESEESDMDPELQAYEKALQRAKRKKTSERMAKMRGLRTWKNARGKLLSQ
jgi:hypothetical protein